jgi:hypothetical protein
MMALLSGACRDTPERSHSVGHLEVVWNGRTRGNISTSATAGWCAPRRVLEIRAIKGDTGIALALYPGKSIAPGAYRVVDGARAESVPPAARIAVRLLAANTVQGFRGDSGRVDLERSSSGQLSGSVRARARSVVDTQRISLSGTFRGLTVLPDSLGCTPPDTADDDADAGDTGIH